MQQCHLRNFNAVLDRENRKEAEKEESFNPPTGRRTDFGPLMDGDRRGSERLWRR